ncbi:hypothetical protein B0H34DRAFT_215834 [Crassisporium funariophilum]|nr:hypothetical protein B0H34DRAFT_215834 [Crassisporium funariophilum]
MTAPRLPALRLTAEGECVIQEGIQGNIPPSNSKFSVSYAPSEGRQNSLLAGGTSPQDHDHPALSSSEGEQSSDDNSGDEGSSTFFTASSNVASPTLSSSQSYTAQPAGTLERVAPQFSRTLSMPLPSQLSQLQNPHRPSPLAQVHSSALGPLSESSRVRELSLELADSIQMVIQTMLQISPPQVLDPAKEQFSACALSVPTSSMSAIFTAMKNINYISANMSSFCEQVAVQAPGSPPAREPASNLSMHNEFDIGEMMQCVGDALSGAAAQVGVDLVLYHGDVGLKHVYVSGDESGISFALSHIVRQVLNTAERGDSIELGLLVSPLTGGSFSESVSSMEKDTPVDDLLGATPLESSGPVQCTIRISHKYAPSETHQGEGHPKDVVTTEIRPKPSFSTLLLRRILKQIDGRLISDLPPPEAFTSGRTCDLQMTLERLPLPLPTMSGDLVDDESVNTEPTLDQLSAFGETLKGKRVALYSSAKGSFAHHLSSYLTAWGMDVTHVSPDGQVDGTAEPLSTLQGDLRQSSFNPMLATYQESNVSLGSSSRFEQPPTITEPPSFIFIDDDVDVLKERLQALRFAQQPQPLASRKRPSLSTNHRPRSSPQMARLLGLNNNHRPAAPVVIMHFTSLSNYKLLKDVMQSIAISYAATSTPLPEVMIIPKPAGPRRFLTAIHTAVTKPVVDPFFVPIATSPTSPGVPQGAGSFFSSSINEHGGQNGYGAERSGSSQTHSPSVKNSNRPLGSRSNSDRSTRSGEGNNGNLSTVMPPSPLAYPDNIEYFSAAAQKLGTSPSSGLVIQSPDGQPAGIYFHPRSKNSSRNPSSQSMERDRGQLTIPTPRRGSTSRTPSGGKGDNVSFSALHEARSSSTVETRSVTASSSSTPSTKKSASNGISDGQQQQQPSQGSTVVSSVPRKPTDETLRVSSPPTSPGEGGTTTPSRRGLGKRPANESKDSTGSASSKQKHKSVMNDANIVPPISVLIVDDNPINQTILSTFMRRKKIKYDLASNGQEAVQKWRTGEFHLILMDIQMPVMDGIQATKEIRRMEKANASAGYPPLTPSTEGHTPSETSAASGASSSASDTRSTNSPYRSSVIIVALTASSLQSDRVAALAAGCNDFLTKPVSLLWLNNKIIEWGSIKALQMWADIRPDAMASITNGQAQQARNVADRLHVPTKGRATPSPTRRTTSILEDNAAALALASSAGTIPQIPTPGGSQTGNVPPSPTSSMFRMPDRPGSASSESASSPQFRRSHSVDANAVNDVLESQSLSRKSGSFDANGATT